MKLTAFVSLLVGLLHSAAALAQVNLTAETTGPGGSTYLATSHLAEVAGTAGIANIQLSDGQTLTNAVQNVAEGKTDIASAPHILPFLMQRGVGPFGALGAEEGAALAGNLRAIYPYTLGVFFLYAYDAKGIEGWNGLAGKKIFNGPPRGGALANARAMIQIVTGLKDGEGYEGIQANWGQSTTMISGGEPDAVILPELFPSARISTLGASGRLTAWSLPQDIYDSDAMQKYSRAPGSAPFETPVAELAAILGENWTFVSENDSFRAIATIGGDVVHKDMDEDLVYQLVTAYIAALDALKAKAPFGETVNYDNPALGMCGANPVKYHKGATRAWEDAGYAIPACAKDG
ncbi:TAXI family TRAP transporter solute-binding subunit [Sulfitobacter geojensis]|uniref:TAXI family TRAP transporter solute-binding subunit n=1 Tax=Sulfitobacter geojensis TaxID=1342299 RepID=UPI002492E724|nr:TAXI family TRAP transporter solute-binding subunit [Sulfitobacter geojensis]